MQPQPGRASEMIRSEPPLFLTTKVVSMTCPLATVPASLVSGNDLDLGTPRRRLPLGRGLARAPSPARSCQPRDPGGEDRRQREAGSFSSCDASSDSSPVLSMHRGVKLPANRRIFPQKARKANVFRADFARPDLTLPHGADRRDRHGPAGGPARARRGTGSRAATSTSIPRCPPSSNPCKSRYSRGFSPDHVPPDCDAVDRRQRRHPRQRRGGGSRAARPACPLAATGDPPVPAARKDLRRHHGHARQDDDLGADGLAAARLRARPGLPGRRARCRTSGAGTAGAAARTSCSRGTSTTPPSSTAGRSSSTTSRSTSSSATSSTTTRISIPDLAVRPRGLPPGRRDRAAGRRRRRQPRRSAGGRGRSRARAARRVFVSTEDSRRGLRRGDIAYHPERNGLHARRDRGRRPRASPRRFSGRHNVRNALGAIALARGLGLSAGEIAAALPRFAGVRRRLEVKGEKNGHSRRGRLRAPSDRRRRDARRPRARAGPAGESGRSSSRARTRPGARSSRRTTRSAFAGADGLVIAPVFHARRLTPETRHRPRGPRARVRRSRGSRPSRPRRSTRSRTTSAATRGPATS